MRGAFNKYNIKKIHFTFSFSFRNIAAFGPLHRLDLSPKNQRSFSINSANWKNIYISKSKVIYAES